MNDEIQTRPKIVLNEKRNSQVLFDNECLITLEWDSSVDLDLHLFYRKKDGKPVNDSPAAKLLNEKFGNRTSLTSPDDGIVNFSYRGSLVNYPFIKFETDKPKHKSFRISRLDEQDHILIVVNIFNKNTNFTRHKGVVTVLNGDQDIDIPLTNNTAGNHCVVAKIKCTRENQAVLSNINQIVKELPKIDDFT